MTDEIDENEILAAQTIAEFVDRVNQEFGLDWPAEISETFTVGKIWKTKIQVKKDESNEGYIVEGDLSFFTPESPARVRIFTKNLTS
jgi:hypothetical protein